MMGEGRGKQTTMHNDWEAAQDMMGVIRAGLTLWHVQWTKKREREF